MLRIKYIKISTERRITLTAYDLILSSRPEYLEDYNHISLSGRTNYSHDLIILAKHRKSATEDRKTSTGDGKIFAAHCKVLAKRRKTSTEDRKILTARRKISTEDRKIFTARRKIFTVDRKISNEGFGYNSNHCLIYI